MSSLRDQLLKAGVASKKQHQQARSRKKQERDKGEDVQAEQRRRLQQEREEQAARDRELNLQRQQKLAEKEAKARLRQILQQHSIEREAGDRAYNFVDDGRVKKWYLSEKQAGHLTRGQLALARRDPEEYVLIPGIVAARLQEKGIDCLLVYNRQGQSAADDEQDPYYLDYQIPDDLIW